MLFPEMPEQVHGFRLAADAAVDWLLVHAGPFLSGLEGNIQRQGKRMRRIALLGKPPYNDKSGKCSRIIKQHGENMREAKLFANGRFQAVRLPKEFSFQGKSVLIRRIGKSVLLSPKDNPWESMFEALEQFSDDFMAEGRNQPSGQRRKDAFA
jgi:antitoxin VapB